MTTQQSGDSPHANGGDTPAKWYYVQGNKSFGPLKESLLHVLVNSGQLRPRTFVYSDALTAWTPYTQAFAEQIKAAAPLPRGQVASSDSAMGTPSGLGPKREIRKGLAVGIGFIAIVAALLGYSRISNQSIEDAHASQAGDGEFALILGRTGGTNAPGSSGDIRGSNAAPGSGLVRRGRGRLGSSEMASADGFGAGDGNTLLLSRTSILGESLRIEEVRRMLDGKAKGAIQQLLGPPDELANAGNAWRYFKGVRIYDEGADLTYFELQLEFRFLPRPGGGAQPTSSVTRVSLVPDRIRPQAGRAEAGRKRP